MKVTPTVVLGLLFTIGTASASAEEARKAQSDPAVERARREVRMLDDIYKTSIVLITTHYVHTDDDLPAGTAFKALFSAVKKKGWHEVRLLDATGEPYNDENTPQQGFEKKAVQQLLNGRAVYDEIVTAGDKRYLLAATAIPVVMDKCVMCHENYKDVPKGKAIGAIGYKVPILD
ncbi:MAG: DUF3365 domain-containing protein [Fuerstiella sp.]|jgi:hypothetical protein|nr:DUF3365 domain-containing protein [Fuerstiella sp.]MCP4511073.1 DUF3365 domain-containing protein [Fuerstiella sp.]MDG2126508.1 DUF3365 domain-containing protein [Fuerstiella sp.]